MTLFSELMTVGSLSSAFASLERLKVIKFFYFNMMQRDTIEYLFIFLMKIQYEIASDDKYDIKNRKQMKYIPVKQMYNHYNHAS